MVEIAKLQAKIVLNLLQEGGLRIILVQNHNLRDIQPGLEGLPESIGVHRQAIIHRQTILGQITNILIIVLNMKTFLVCFVILILSGMIWASWKIHFWTQEGKIFFNSRWKIASYDFEIWQRKNKSYFEPFETALFVKPDKTNEWQAFSIDFQDIYSPKIELTDQGAMIEIFRDGKQFGFLIKSNCLFWRVNQETPIFHDSTQYPSNWLKGVSPDNN